MRHRVTGRGFGRNTNQRKALLRGLVIALFEHQRIETTLAKAKEAKKMAEHIITLARAGDLHSRRLALSCIGNKNAVLKLFDEIIPKLKQRNGGYLRVLKSRVRPGDGSSMAILEFVDYESLRKEKKEKEEKKKKVVETRSGEAAKS
ncbi:MAG TPA: 50S ribosomal protein L17 [Nitrospiraceae bacterium]|nr:50S ribosomal protein L17 [Nitrospiraceae bacterium]